MLSSAHQKGRQIFPNIYRAAKIYERRVVEKNRIYVTCMAGTRDEMTGSSTDDRILLALWLQSLSIPLNHNPIAIAHSLRYSLR
jgi:hypothetical protein